MHIGLDYHDSTCMAFRCCFIRAPMFASRSASGFIALFSITSTLHSTTAAENYLAPPGMAYMELMPGSGLKPSLFVNRAQTQPNDELMAGYVGNSEIAVINISDGSLKFKVATPTSLEAAPNLHVQIEGNFLYAAVAVDPYHATKDAKVIVSELNLKTRKWEWTGTASARRFNYGNLSPYPSKKAACLQKRSMPTFCSPMLARSPEATSVERWG